MNLQSHGQMRRRHARIMPGTAHHPHRAARRATSIRPAVRTARGRRLHVVGSSHDGLPTGNVTFLFSDIEGSTRLAQDLGHEAWARLLSEHDNVIDLAVADADGVVVKHEGDGAFAVFSD